MLMGLPLPLGDLTTRALKLFGGLSFESFPDLTSHFHGFREVTCSGASSRICVSGRKFSNSMPSASSNSVLLCLENQHYSRAGLSALGEGEGVSE